MGGRRGVGGWLVAAAAAQAAMQKGCQSIKASAPQAQQQTMTAPFSAAPSSHPTPPARQHTAAPQPSLQACPRVHLRGSS